MKMLKNINKSRLIATHEQSLLVLEKKGDTKRYTLPGGITKKGENDFRALLREVKEETDLNLEEKKLTYFVSVKNRKKKENICKNYFIHQGHIEEFSNLEPNKFKRIFWISWKDALNYLDQEDGKAVALYFNSK